MIVDENNSRQHNQSRLLQRFKTTKNSYQGEEVLMKGVKRYFSKGQAKSGKFINCEYVPPDLYEQPKYHKKNVKEARDKYQNGQLVSQYLKHSQKRRHKSIVAQPSGIITTNCDSIMNYDSRANSSTNNNQQRNEHLRPNYGLDKIVRQGKSIGSNLTLISRRSLPSYRSSGIKDIIEYHHAGHYKNQKITQKCTKVQHNNKFEGLMEYDFRKKTIR